MQKPRWSRIQYTHPMYLYLSCLETAAETVFEQRQWLDDVDAFRRHLVPLQKSTVYSQLRRVTDVQTDIHTDIRKCDLNSKAVTLK